MDFEEYKRQIVHAAINILRDIPEWRGMICVDTVKNSWDEELPVNLATERAVDDTLYWDGAYY